MRISDWSSDVCSSDLDAVRLLQHLLELRQEVVGEAEPVEIEHHRPEVEQAHDHALAVRGGPGVHAQVQFLALHAQHDAAVLRQAALGDVEPRNDFDAAERSAEQTSELQSLMHISYAALCLRKTTMQH